MLEKLNKLLRTVCGLTQGFGKGFYKGWGGDPVSQTFGKNFYIPHPIDHPLLGGSCRIGNVRDGRTSKT